MTLNYFVESLAKEEWAGSYRLEKGSKSLNEEGEVYQS